MQAGRRARLRGSRPAVLTTEVSNMYRTSYLLAASWAMLLVGGCGEQATVVNVQDPADFQHQVIESQAPVVVEMYKGG
jgi:hypothetical protein